MFGGILQYFLDTLQGSPIRRIGFDSWQRNIAVALGNAPYSQDIEQTLTDKLTTASELVAEHIHWALAQQQTKKAQDSLLAEKNNSNERLTNRLIRSIEKGLPRDA